MSDTSNEDLNDATEQVSSDDSSTSGVTSTSADNRQSTVSNTVATGTSTADMMPQPLHPVIQSLQRAATQKGLTLQHRHLQTLNLILLIVVQQMKQPHLPLAIHQPISQQKEVMTFHLVRRV